MSSTSFGATDEDAPLYCANHPKEQTYLRCGRCDKPICAKCRVSTPAGWRCRECANIQVLPTYAVSSEVYIRAALFGFLAAAAAGILMGLFPSFEFWAALIMGVAVPEAVSVASNQKRGPGLQAVGMAAVLFGFIVSRIVIESFPQFIPSLGGINAPYGAGIPLLDNLPFYLTQYSIVWLALALFLANRRLR
jgi:hypothetical protein